MIRLAEFDAFRAFYCLFQKMSLLSDKELKNLLSECKDVALEDRLVPYNLFLLLDASTCCCPQEALLQLALR